MARLGCYNGENDRTGEDYDGINDGTNRGRVTATELTKRHPLVVGQTGSGKTTTTLALLSQLQQTSQTAIILDPTGEYAKLPNTITYRLGVNAYLEAGALTAPQLLRVLELPADPWLVTKLEAAITALRIQKNLLATPASTKSGGAWRVSLKTRWLGWGSGPAITTSVAWSIRWLKKRCTPTQTSGPTTGSSARSTTGRR